MMSGKVSFARATANAPVLSGGFPLRRWAAPSDLSLRPRWVHHHVAAVVIDGRDDDEDVDAACGDYGNADHDVGHGDGDEDDDDDDDDDNDDE